MIGNQLTLPQLKRHMAQTRIAVGSAGEMMVARALEAQGYRVSIPHERGDLTAILTDGQILSIEVKTARKGKDGKYRFTLIKYWQGRTCTDHRNTDLVILVCILKTGDAVPFVIPTATIGNRRALAISSYPTDYTGWLAPFRQSLNSINLEKSSCVLMKPM